LEFDMANRLAAYDPQLEIFEGDQAPAGLRRDRFLGEIQEIELATELMELRDEVDLHRFVGGLVRGTARAMGRGRGFPAAEAIQRLLISMLRQAIPRQRSSAATIIAPTLGDRLVNIQDHSLGLELEGLSEEDRQFETARQIVRFASDAAEGALTPSVMDPAVAARAAALAAARRHAPGLVASSQAAEAAIFEPEFKVSAGPGPPSIRSPEGGRRLNLFVR